MRCEERGAGEAIARLICFEQAFERGNQFGSRGGFAHKALRAQKSHGRFGFGRGLLHGEEENLCCRRDAANLVGGLDAVHHRHIDVEKHQFGIERPYLSERLLAVCRLAADAQSVRIQKRAYGVPRDVMIVNQ